jgi:hypothetical protein
LHDELATTGREYAQSWSAPELARRMLALYERVIGGGKRPTVVAMTPGMPAGSAPIAPADEPPLPVADERPRRRALP